MKGVDGKSVARLRQGRGWSQAELARRVNQTEVVSTHWFAQTVTKVERDVRGLTLAEGLVLATMFDVDPAVLCDDLVRFA